MSKIIFLLDTNVLIHSPKSLFDFPQGCVGITYHSIEELDAIKKESTERGYNAREVIRLLDSLREQGNITQGITLDHQGTLQVFMPAKNLYSELSKSVDDQIIAIARELKESGSQVKLVSKDINIRIKADAFSIDVQDYQSESVTQENFYLGWREYVASSGEIKFKVEDLLTQILNEKRPEINEFTVLKNQHNEHQYRIFRYLGGDNFKEVSLESHLLWGIEPKNHHQAMAMDLLLDDDIQMVALLGPSGTGKTFVTLAMLLQKVLHQQIFQKILISRPVVPLGPDIGYLPGDLEEKLHTWMQPIRDNLELVIHQINAYQSNDAEMQYSFNKQKKHKKHNKHVKQSLPELTVDDLTTHSDKVCFESITYMRGRSIPYQAIFIDEVQNLTAHEVKTLISRAGEGSKIILAGDPYQIDSQYLTFANNGLVIASERFKGQSVFGTVYLQISERSLLSSLANELM